eukprot:scaffold17554_cov148-Isochrysis_galbana.AAC.1
MCKSSVHARRTEERPPVLSAWTLDAGPVQTGATRWPRRAPVFNPQLGSVKGLWPVPAPAPSGSAPWFVAPLSRPATAASALVSEPAPTAGASDD